MTRAKKRKLYDEKQDSSINRENGFQPYYCWFLDEPRDSPLYYARFLSPDHANTAASCWDRLTEQEMCEGFSNKETCSVAHHLDNVKWIQDAYLTHRTGSAGNVRDFAERLQNMLENWREDFLTRAKTGHLNSLTVKQQKDLTDMFGDIGSLWRVNWKELAEHLLKD